MTPVKRRIAAVSAPVLLALSLSACGGGADGAPDDASEGDFCDQYVKLLTLESGKDINDWGSEMSDVGTPEGVSDDERKGFEVLVDAAGDVDEDAKPEDIEEPDVSDDDRDAVDSFTTYAGETCVDQLGEELGGEVPE